MGCRTGVIGMMTLGKPVPGETDVRCIACGKSLFFLPDSYPLVFHCEDGHFLTIQDLLDEELPQGKTAPTAALEFWTRKAGHLRALAASSLGLGHAFIAADLQDTAGRIDQWVTQLKGLLARAEGSENKSDSSGNAVRNGL